MQYLVVDAKNSQTLAEKVNQFLSSGWRLVGGVSVAVYTFEDDGRPKTGKLYAQAMASPGSHV